MLQGAVSSLLDACFPAPLCVCGSESACGSHIRSAHFRHAPQRTRDATESLALAAPEAVHAALAELIGGCAARELLLITSCAPGTLSQQ